MSLARQAGLILALIGAAFALSCRSKEKTAPAEASYVRSELCRSCHEQIYQTYQRVGMSHSVTRPSDSNVIEDYTKNNRFYHAASRRHYEMIRRDGKFFQRRWETDASGAAVNVFEREVHYIIGSGNHARSYLHWSNGELIELPITWYSAERRWAMSPGYDHARHSDFRRRVDYGCLFCHNAYPEVQPGGDRYGRSPRFPQTLPLGIDCQRCHGPGSRHVELAGKTTPSPDQVKAAIVNPARLKANLQMDVCLQCHLETTSSTLPASTRRFDRGVYSFRPGERLSDYTIYFDHGKGHEDKFEIAGGAYRLLKSQCFLKSGGRLTCLSCHNPHELPRGDAAVAYYRGKCQACHPQPAGAVHASSNDCIGCHMPKRRTDDAVHVVMTDHLIQRSKPVSKLLAGRQEQHDLYRGPVVLYRAPELTERERDLYLGIAHTAERADLNAGIAMLERQASNAPAKALVALADAYAARGDSASAAQAYSRALAQDASLVTARLNYALNLPAEAAIQEYERVIRDNPDFAEAHYGLANALIKARQLQRAALSFREAIRLSPDYAEAYANLGGLLAEQGGTDEAAKLLTEALRIEPGLASAHNNIAKIFAVRGETASAMRHLQRALESEPKHTESRLNLGRLMYQLGRTEAAIVEFRRAVDQSPQSAEAHLSLGVALGEKGDIDGAVAQFREVLRLEPDHPDARRNLELALQMQRR